ncbi:hypothetical protein LSH36_96g06018 [Paralvinella palmiformis]|uniref:G-protein coupled receptors family 1 profile domain-containing protein n=1 Tax=Paralvinella palmiformis TaxID=53620 RepID=A0AAD9K0B1_9ANNE|nr:hypothetical protein LSH36_96g06018 [Paralvinella palmiformis]
MAETVRNGSDDMTAISATSMDQSEHCHLFHFVVDTVLTGVLCLFGFAGNTMAFMTIWPEKFTVTTYLLEAIIVSDLAVVWMIFLGDCVPGLSWALQLLEDCQRVCGYVSAVTRPLLQLAQLCGVWLTLAVLVNRYLVMCRHGAAAILQNGPSAARRHVIVIVIVATVVTLPLTVERHVDVTVDDGNGTLTRHLHDVYWYQLLYHDLIGTLLVYVIPLVLQLVLLMRLACVVHSVNQLRSSLATSFRLHHVDITQLVLTLSVTMVICYTPLIIEKTLLWIQGHPAMCCATLTFYLHSFARLFTALNSSMKMVLLLLFVGDFRHRLGEMLTCYWASEKDTDQLTTGYTMYRCPDMSEMTLISNVDSRT